MANNRVLGAGIGMLATAAVLVGCSDDKGDEPSASSTSTSSVAQVASGGNTEVKVEGMDVAGLDLSSVTCVKAGGKISVASGPVGDSKGLGVIMTDETTPKVETVGLVVDGIALMVTPMGGADSGSAEVKVDGSTYTITGVAVGPDLKDPMAGMVTKKFEINVNCS